MTTSIEKRESPGDEQTSQEVNRIVDKTITSLASYFPTPDHLGEISTKENLGPVNDKKESVEKLTTPRLKKENHKIDKDMSLEEKLNNGWNKEKSTAYINGKETNITILKKTIQGAKEDAFAWEYLEGVPANLIWEQLFNWNAMLNLGIDKKLPSYKQMLAIRGDDHDKFLADNFQKNDENLFSGCCFPNNEFYYLSMRMNCWLSDGNRLEISEDGIHYNNGYPMYGFSARLLED